MSLTEESEQHAHEAAPLHAADALRSRSGTAVQDRGQRGANAHTTHLAESHGDRLDTLPERPGASFVPAAEPRRGLSGSLWITLAVAALLVIAVVLYGILSRAAAQRRLERVTVEAAIPTVNVVHPSTGRVSAELSLPGSTQAFVDTPIYSRTSGYLKKWFFDIGAHVRRGQLMATIETPEIDQQLQASEADLKIAKANLSLADTTSARYQKLLKLDSVSRQETDEAMGNAESKQAQVEASSAAVRRLQQLQSFEKIYAPFDGIVTARNTDVGSLIVAGQESNGDARELFHLASMDRLRVFVPVPEADAASIQAGQHATLTADAFPGRIFDGVVTRNSNAVDPATRTLNVEVDVPNPKGLLLPGAYLFVHFKLPTHPGTLTIPANTLLFRSEGLQVALVRNGRVHLEHVTIAHDNGATVETQGGLSAQDSLILDPSDSIADGQQVHVAASASPRLTPGGGGQGSSSTGATQ